MTPEQRFQLRIIDREDNERIYALGDRLIQIGRAPNVDLTLADDQVSGRHAVVEWDGERYTISDAGSTNGTLLNRNEIRNTGAIPLHDGDRLEIDGFTIYFEVRPPESPPPSPQPSSPEEKKPKPSKPSKEQDDSPPTIPPPVEKGLPPYWGEVPPGLSRFSSRLINYLPEIYHPPRIYTNGSSPNGDATSNAKAGSATIFGPGVSDSGGDGGSSRTADTDSFEADLPHNFMSRYLAIFESLLLPMEWTADGFDLFVHPATAPAGFLPWLASWFDLTFDQTWSESQRRELIADAYWLFSMRGTKSALSRILEIYTGQQPHIDDESDHLHPHTFEVTLPVLEQAFERALIERIINAHKPAHTVYKLEFSG